MKSNSQAGAALIIALMAMLLLMSLGLMLVLSTALETLIAAHFRAGQEAFYASDAGLERVMDDLDRAVDWSTVLTGADRSAFVDGPSPGTRTLSDGSSIDLTAATNQLNGGVNNPRWNLYAYGPLNAMVPTGTINSDLYVAVWVCDAPQDPGSGVMAVRSQAFGPGGIHRVVEATVTRQETLPPAHGLRLIAWKQIN